MSGFTFLGENKRLILTAIAAFAVITALFGTPRHADAATQIYYSVGQNTNDHKQGSPTVTISGSTATFSVEQNATNTGIGDKINFGGSSVFITGRVSSTTWNVQTATGTTPVATSSATVTSITHAFASLKGAIGTGFANNATSTNYLNTSDLVAGNYQLNIPLYYDTGPDTTAVIIAGFTTDATHYVRVYTATSTTEVNYSQRHGGRWTPTAWSFDGSFTNGQPILTRQPFMRFDGLQLRNTAASALSAIDDEVAGGTEGFYLSHSILSLSADRGTCLKFGVAGASYAVHVWDNVITNCSLGIYASMSVYGASQIYNNTIYDVLTGIQLTTTGTASFKVINNLIASSSYAFLPNSKALAGTDYNSVNASTTGLIVTGGPGGHDLASSTPSFVDASNIDFHLQSSDTSALDLGGNLLADANLPVTDDIDSAVRPYNSIFDIGADEYDGTAGDVTPPVRSAGAPSGTFATTTTSATISLTTSENATCKYDTVAGTAYASMPNVFGTTGSTSHSTVVNGLSSGHTYKYYVRCSDGSGNADLSDYLISFSVNTNGTAYAYSCAAADVNAAISLAIAGDTVQLPSCSATDAWGTNTATVSLNKRVTLQGNGTSSTAVLAGPGLALSIAASQAVVKNFTMRIASTTSPIFMSVIGTVDRWRVTGMWIDQEGVPFSGTSYVFYISNQLTTANTYGLIDNNTFTGIVGEVFFWRGPCNSWDTPNTYGQGNALFLEGNTFVSTSTGYMDTNANGRIVVRYNDLTKVYIDGHGMNTNYDQCTPERHASVRTEEIYNNRFIGPGSTSVYVHGGSALIYNNTVEATSTGPGKIWMEQVEITTPSSIALPMYFPVVRYACKTDYPIIYQLGRGLNSVVGPTLGSQQASEPLFIWNNTYAPYGTAISNGFGYSGGAADPLVRTACGDPTYQVSDVVVQDRDFCAHDTSTACNGFDLTSYSAYTCPNPLTGASGGCNSGLVGVAGYNVLTKPTVSTSAATIATTTATLNGSISATNGADATQSGFAWGTASSLSGGDTATTTLGAQTGAASLASPISSLSCNTTYYFKPYATNSAGTSYGLVTSFTTKACASALSTGDADSLSATAATLHASISSTGGANAEDSGFAYGTDSALQNGVSTTTEGVQSGTASFVHALSGLTCGTTYYARAYVRTVAGDSFGMIKSLTTSACPVTPPPQTGGGGGGGVSMLGSGPSTFTSPIYAPGYAPASVPKTTGAKPAGGFSQVMTSAGLGSSGVHVKSIQTMLNYAGFTVAASGAGSPGNETSYFGPLTRKAVQAFQLYHQIAKPGDSGFGYVGPKTKAKLNALVGAH